VFKTFHKLARIASRTNRATRTTEVVASGNPKRPVRLAGRSAAYRLFNRLMNKVR
jgi:hypothetical protein